MVAIWSDLCYNNIILSSVVSVGCFTQRSGREKRFVTMRYPVVVFLFFSFSYVRSKEHSDTPQERI